MTFDERYPEAEPGIPVSEFIVMTLHHEQRWPCTICGEITRWFHRELIEHICSEKCLERCLERNYCQL